MFKVGGKYILKFHSLNGFSDENNAKILRIKSLCMDHKFWFKILDISCTELRIAWTMIFK